MDDDQIKDFNDLPSVDPVDSDELLCGRGRIAFSAFVALMKGDIEAAVSLAEQAKSDTEDIYDLAEELLEAVQTAKSETETIKSETATLKTETEVIKTATATIKSETETIKTETQASATSAQNAAEAAEESATEAAAAAATIATTTELAQLAQKKGELYFPNNTRAYTSNVDLDTSSPFTICSRVKGDSDGTSQTFFSSGNGQSPTAGFIVHYNAQYNYIGVSLRYSYNNAVGVNYESAVASKLMDGNWHNVVFVIRGTIYNESTEKYTLDADFYLDGEIQSGNIKNLSSDIDRTNSNYLYFNSGSTAFFIDAGCNVNSGISNFKIFNFELPASDEADTDSVGYTIQDYINGLDVPALLQYEDSEKRCVYALENYTYTSGSTQYIPASIGSKLICVTTSSASNSPKGTHDNAIATLIAQANTDLSSYATSTALTSGLATKQNTLTAGDNIDITNNVIKATGLATSTELSTLSDSVETIAAQYTSGNSGYVIYKRPQSDGSVKYWVKQWGYIGVVEGTNTQNFLVSFNYSSPQTYVLVYFTRTAGSTTSTLVDIFTRGTTNSSTDFYSTATTGITWNAEGYCDAPTI